MNASCTACGKPFSFDDSRFGARATVKVRCPACKAVVTLTRPEPAAARASKPAAAASGGGGSRKASKSGEDGGSPTQKLKRDEVIAAAGGGEMLLPMPAGKRVSLAVLGGKLAGKVLQCEKSRMVIGRAGADLNVEDDEVSRRHAVLEIRDDRFVLKDLGSTNGTFVEERKIAEQEIFDKSEFRVGGTQIMLIVTPKDDV